MRLLQVKAKDHWKNLGEHKNKKGLLDQLKILQHPTNPGNDHYFRSLTVVGEESSPVAVEYFPRPMDKTTRLERAQARLGIKVV